MGYFDILDDNLNVKYQALMDRIHRAFSVL